MLDSSLFDRAGEGWAEIRAHDRVTRYRRRGSGRPVLLLCDSPDSPLWELLLNALSECYRVIIPEFAQPGAEGSFRLADFLEGLGCRAVSVIADAALASAALAVALGGCDQIARVIIVADAPLAIDQGAADVVPTLVIVRHHSSAQMLTLVRDFLQDG
jgi:hypothetical protein